MQEIFERLVAANITILPASAIVNHVLFERGGYVSLVERTPGGLGRAGTGGLLTEHGYAALVWRGESAAFVCKGGYERAATSDDIADLRKFQTDLEQAISAT